MKILQMKIAKIYLIVIMIVIIRNNMVMLYTASTMVKLPSMDSILVPIIKIE